MKAVAPHAFVVQGAGQGKRIVHPRVVAVEGGVETRHLHHVWKRGLRRADARQVVGLVQGCKGRQGFKLGQ
jgi:hypothetical protein